MKKGHRIIGWLLVGIFLFSLLPKQVYASEKICINNTENETKNKNFYCSASLDDIARKEKYDDILKSEYFHEGPSVEFDLSKENNYSDKIIAKGISGVTAISCSLSGHTGGIDGLYEIIIHWQGNNRVNAISASKLYINNGNILSPKTFRTNGFRIECKSKCSGYSIIGTCYIPKEVKSVRVSSKLLQAYFNDRDYWIRLNELYGTINL